MPDAVKEFISTGPSRLKSIDAELAALLDSPSDKQAISGALALLRSLKEDARQAGVPTIDSVAYAGESVLQALLDSGEIASDSVCGLLIDINAALNDCFKYLQDGEEVPSKLYDELLERCVQLQETLASDQSIEMKNEQHAVPGSDNTPSDDDASDDSLVEDDDEDDLDDEPVVEVLDDEMKEVLRDFLQESYDNLDRVDSELIELEEQPENRDVLSSIFRSIHTIKGTCGFFGFEKLEKVTHVGENLLVKLRDGEYRMTEDIANGLLGMVDAVRVMLGEISDNGHDGRKRYKKLIAQLSELKDHGQLKASTGQVSKDSKSDAAGSSIKSEEPAAPDTSAGTPPADKSTVENAPTVVKPEPAVTEDSSSGASAQGKKSQSKPPAAEKSAMNAVEATIRVDVPLLDSLMNLVGELVLARNQIVEYVGSHENSQVVAAAQRLNIITSELQEGVMQTRMQPIHSVWAKLPRVVRDLARACGKQIRVEMEGKSTELDKSLIEAMKDPITHLVRNSVDHGIESPEERVAAGKPAEGTLLLRAFHEGGQVHIEISDDGGGIKPDRIRQKAIDKGLITADQAARLTDQEVCKMIFLPGLSTAEAVTNISGRGVGMDVVKTNIEKISGAIDLDSEIGRGTVFKIRVPLTLAIVPALIVSTGAQRFAIPQVNLIELIRIDEEDQARAIEFIHGCPVHRLRGQLLPLVYLHEELMLGPPEHGALNIVVLQAEKCRFGLVVDQINDTQEIVVKPLAEALKNIPVFAGATIMGDGRVALILDTLGIAQRARVMSDSSERSVSLDVGNVSEKSGQSETLLLVSTACDGRLAIPLNRVARLEQFETERTEMAGNNMVVQYRGQILPLIHLSEYLLERRAGYADDAVDDGLIQVVVFGEEGRQVGLIVKEIIDVVDEVLRTRGKASRDGVLGTASIDGQVTELLDVSAFIAATANLIIDREEAA